jgi:hypothetical protein
MNKFLNIMGFVMKLIPSDAVEEIETSIAETLLDTIEAFVKRSDNTIDDILVLPMIKALRIAYDNKQENEVTK